MTLHTTLIMTLFAILNMTLFTALSMTLLTTLSMTLFTTLSMMFTTLIFHHIEDGYVLNSEYDPVCNSDQSTMITTPNRCEHNYEKQISVTFGNSISIASVLPCKNQRL
jgi:hypothetical protein